MRALHRSGLLLPALFSGLMAALGGPLATGCGGGSLMPVEPRPDVDPGDGDGDGDPGDGDGDGDAGDGDAGDGDVVAGDGDGDGDGDDEMGLCHSARIAFAIARATCNALDQQEDASFDTSACAGAIDDDYDHTAFYGCLIDAFTGPASEVCTPSGDVWEFEDLSSYGDPPGCYELRRDVEIEPPVGGLEVDLCYGVLETFFYWADLCGTPDQPPDPWFSEEACLYAEVDDYDNTDFYLCLLTRFSGSEAQVCSPSGGVHEFEDLPLEGDPPGCYELFNATPEGPDVPVDIPVGGPEVELCQATLAAFYAATEVCMDDVSTPDPWFSEATCEAAAGDGYDNTAFYLCNIEKLSGDAAQVCEEDELGNLTNEVIEFEDLPYAGEPSGCYDFYNVVPGDSAFMGGVP